MAVELVNPERLPRVDLYHHVSIATGSRLVHLAGQVSWDRDGTLVGRGDLVAQVEQCLLNVATSLAAVGGDLDDLTDLTAYFVDVDDSTAAAYEAGVARASSRLGVAVPRVPFTGIGVVALAGSDLLVEIKATAVLG